MRTMKDSGIEWIGRIPADWETDRLQWHLEEIKEQNFPIQSERVLSLTVESGVIPYEDKGNQGNKSKENYEEYKLAYPETLVINSMNVIIGAVGISKYFGCVSPVYYVFRPTVVTDLRYIYYLFTNIGFQKELRKHAKGIMEIRLRISASETLKRVIPKPSYEEQCRIADFLDRRCAEIDTVIERTKATIEEYKKLRQSIVTDAVTKGIRSERALKNTGVEWIRVVPVDWEMVRGKGLFVETNARSTTGEEELLTVSQYTGVTPRSQKNVNMFEAESLEGYKICKVGDIAANTMWLWAGAIGVSEYEGVISPSYNLYRQSGDNYNSKYLDYLLRSTPLVQCYESMSTGIRASRLRLYPQQFLSIRFPVPPMAEQVEIVAYLDKKCAEMDALIARKTALLNEMESYKKSVIYEYVTGKKEVH